MKKKILSLTLVVCLLAIAVVGGTLAYFTDTDNETNTFTLGNVDIDLVEDWDEPDTVIPGVTYDKVPTVKNIGKNDAWVRVDVTVTDAAAFKATLGEGYDLSVIFDGHDETVWTLDTVVEDATADTITYRYFHNELLGVGEETDAIFTSVTLPGELFNNAAMEALGDDFDITVVAHAIQESEDYTTVQGAFAAY